MRLNTLRIATLLMLFAGGLLADHRLGVFRTFDQLDQDRSGRLEGNEWSLSRPSFFHWLDRHADSVLSRDEYPQTQEEFLRLERIHDWDQDKDRVLTRQEWRGSIPEFERLDADQDDQLAWEEYAGARQDTELLFRDHDRDRDSRISGREWRGPRATFNQIDVNGDGVITAEEYSLRGDAAERERRFRAWDRNRNGRIEQSEWRESASLFQRLDRNHDSVLTMSEFTDVHGLSSDISLDPTNDMSRTTATFRQMDSDRDGFIYGDEWPGDMELYYQLDRNNDGALSRTEFLRRLR